MKCLGLVLPLLLVAACGGTKELVPEKPPAFVLDDCALLGALERDHFKASSSAPLRTWLNGESVAWKPACDWSGMGVALVDKAPAVDDSGDLVTINRPRYDVKGVQIRIGVKHGAGAPEHALCRLHRVEDAWKLQTCGPDPKDTQPPPPPPSPADQTPDKSLPIPLNPPPSARNPQSITPDPGAPVGVGPGSN